MLALNERQRGFEPGADRVVIEAQYPVLSLGADIEEATRTQPHLHSPMGTAATAPQDWQVSWRVPKCLAWFDAPQL